MVPENVCVFLPNQKAERRRPFGTGLVRHCPQGLFSPFFTFLRAIFSRQFRLSLSPTICPWVRACFLLCASDFIMPWCLTHRITGVPPRILEHHSITITLAYSS